VCALARVERVLAAARVLDIAPRCLVWFCVRFPLHSLPFAAAAATVCSGGDVVGEIPRNTSHTHSRSFTHTCVCSWDGSQSAPAHASAGSTSPQRSLPPATSRQRARRLVAPAAWAR
jgi:hypothetical protein